MSGPLHVALIGQFYFDEDVCVVRDRLLKLAQSYSVG
jgi:hypothetical protein